MPKSNFLPAINFSKRVKKHEVHREIGTCAATCKRYGSRTLGRLEASMGWTRDGGGLAIRTDLDHSGVNLLIPSLLHLTKGGQSVGLVCW